MVTILYQPAGRHRGSVFSHRMLVFVPLSRVFEVRKNELAVNEDP